MQYFVLLSTFLFPTIALYIPNNRLIQYKFFEINLCIDVCLKHTQSFNRKVENNLIRNNPIKEIEYRDLLEVKNYIIDNCNDDNILYFGWNPCNHTYSEYESKKNVVPHAFLFIKDNNESQNIYLEMIVCNPFSLHFDFDSNTDTKNLQITLKELASQNNKNFIYDKIEFIKNKKWILDLNL
jgi:hypothetical protein